MPKEKKKIVDGIHARIQRIDKQLRAQPWFKRGAWLTSVHAFPSQAELEGFTFHVYKKNWFNEKRQGIHVESYLDLDPLKQKKSYVALHILHEEKIPWKKLTRFWRRW